MPADAAPWDTPENAAAYARFCRVHGYRRDAARALARFAGLARDARVADLGCGTGVSTRSLAARVPAGRVIGLDPAPAMLAEARRAGRSRRVMFALGDSADLPRLAGEGGFDAVACVSALWLTDDLGATLGHVRAGLRDGGRLVFSVPAEFVGEVEHLLEPGAARFFEALVRARRAEGVSEPRAVTPRVPLTLEGWEAALAAAGFGRFATEVHAYAMSGREALAHLAVPAVAAGYLPGADAGQVGRVLARLEAEVGADEGFPMERRWRHVAVVKEPI